MLNKVILGVAVAVALSTVSFAGGPVAGANGMGGAPGFQPFAYVGVNVGGADVGFKQAVNAVTQSFSGTNAAFTGLKRGNWTLAVGGDLGYMFQQHLGIEVGGNWFRDTTYTGITAPVTNSAGTVKPWNIYGALKLVAPLSRFVNGLSVFAKAGVGYYHIGLSGSATLFSPKSNRSSESHTGPFAAAGLEYMTSMGLGFNAQWSHFDGDINAKQILPSTNIFSGGISYHFNV